MLGAGSALVEMALESLLRSDKQEKKSYVWLPITANGPAPRGTGSKRRGEEGRSFNRAVPCRKCPARAGKKARLQTPYSPYSVNHSPGPRRGLDRGPKES